MIVIHDSYFTTALLNNCLKEPRMELHYKLNITEFHEQEQSAISTVLFKTKAPNSPILHFTFSNKLTFNRILEKNL